MSFKFQGYLRHKTHYKPPKWSHIIDETIIFLVARILEKIIFMMPACQKKEVAWRLANQTDFGLVAGVFTQDISITMRAASKLDAGQVFINEWYAGGIETPFGGNKRSGFGREKGVEALQSYVRTKNVAIRVNHI